MAHHEPDLAASDEALLEVGDAPVPAGQRHVAQLHVHVVLALDQVAAVHLPGLDLNRDRVALCFVQQLDLRARARVAQPRRGAGCFNRRGHRHRHRHHRWGAGWPFPGCRPFFGGTAAPGLRGRVEPCHSRPQNDGVRGVSESRYDVNWHTLVAHPGEVVMRGAAEKAAHRDADDRQRHTRKPVLAGTVPRYLQL